MQATHKATNCNERQTMHQTDISKLKEIDGFIAGCLVDSETGLMMASVGGDDMDLEMASAANTEVLRAKLGVIKAMELEDEIDDILILLGKQIHLIHPLETNPFVFIYVALDKANANLEVARWQVEKLDRLVVI